MFDKQNKSLAWHNPPLNPEKWGWGSDETSRILFSHVNFPETNGVTSGYGGTKSNNHKEGGRLVITKVLYKNKNIK